MTERVYIWSLAHLPSYSWCESMKLRLTLASDFVYCNGVRKR